MQQVESTQVDDVLALVLSAFERKPASTLPRRLDGLFKDLGSQSPARDPSEIVELIWALWITHPEDSAADSMIAAIEAISAGANDLARPILDRLVAKHPDWAEAWNKRATLAYLEERDPQCLSDIHRTLTLEPRHFGAMLGFGQICVRQSRVREARAAFQVALAINPHLHGLRSYIVELAASKGGLH